MKTICQHRAIPCVPLAFRESASRFLTAVTPFYKPTLTTSVRVEKSFIIFFMHRKGGRQKPTAPVWVLLKHQVARFC